MPFRPIVLTLTIVAAALHAAILPAQAKAPRSLSRKPPARAAPALGPDGVAKARFAGAALALLGVVPALAAWRRARRRKTTAGGDDTPLDGELMWQNVPPIWGPPNTDPPTAPPIGETPNTDREVLAPIWGTPTPIWGTPTPTSETPAPMWEMPEPPSSCAHCGGQGEICPLCHGNRGHWEHPQTEYGTDQWVPCGYCQSSGRVRCSVCGKGGY